MRVLVAEDERLLADLIARWLRGEAHAVDVAYDGDTALERLGVNDYDVVVLDRDLPVVHGDDVCRALVDSGAETRVLMLTAAAEIGDRTWDVAALRLADGRSYRLGRFARPADDPCRADARYLACATGDGELLLWRYHPDGGS